MEQLNSPLFIDYDLLDLVLTNGINCVEKKTSIKEATNNVFQYYSISNNE